MAAEILRYNKDTADKAVAAVAITVGELIGLNSSGQAVKADADAATPIEAIGVALKTVAAGAIVPYADDCVVKDTSLSLTPPAALFLSGTAGATTATAPTAAGALRQRVGIARTATSIRYRICPEQLVVQAAGTSTVAFA